MALQGRVTVNTDLERMWKEVVVACFQVLYQHLPGVVERTTETLATRVGLRAEIRTRYLPNTKL
jgi:hypothetical protein